MYGAYDAWLEMQRRAAVEVHKDGANLELENMHSSKGAARSWRTLEAVG